MTEYSPYHKIIPERIELLDKITTLLQKKSITHFITEYAERKFPTLSYVINPKIKETIMITAGCHGNEPAPVYAIYNFLKTNLKIKNKRIIVVPCLIPFGFTTHTDLNVNNADINSNFFSNKEKETILLKKLVDKYKPSFVLNLHEDPDERMFFLYLDGHKENIEYKKIANRLILNISKDIKFFKRKKIHSDYVINGIIEYPKVSRTFEDYLREKDIPNFCTETPGLYPLKDRIKVNEKILKFITEIKVPQVLYHGSPNKLKGETLNPSQGEDKKERPENNIFGVYATDRKDFAIAMAILNSKGVIGGSINGFNKQGIDAKIYGELPKQKFIYLHILPKDKFKRTKSISNQFVSKSKVKPINTEKILISEYSHLLKKATKKETKTWIEKYKK